jgi:hypothetical protein
MTDSILDSVKKVLGFDPSYTAFDIDVLMHINTVFSDLNDLGIGPSDGYSITDNTSQWSALLGSDLVLNRVKTYVFLRVRMIFDPPVTSFAIDAMNKQIEQLEWRISVKREGTAWVDPNPPSPAPPLEPCWGWY